MLRVTEAGRVMANSVDFQSGLVETETRMREEGTSDEIRFQFVVYAIVKALTETENMESDVDDFLRISQKHREEIDAIIGRCFDTSKNAFN